MTKWISYGAEKGLRWPLTTSSTMSVFYLSWSVSDSFDFRRASIDSRIWKLGAGSSMGGRSWLRRLLRWLSLCSTEKSSSRLGGVGSRSLSLRGRCGLLSLSAAALLGRGFSATALLAAVWRFELRRPPLLLSSAICCLLLLCLTPDS